MIDLRVQDLADLPAKLAEASLPSDWGRGLEAIFSSKVLHLLSDEELHDTIAAQARLLAPDGVAMHLVWAPAPSTGSGTAQAHHRDEATLRRCWLERFREVDVTPRTELAHHDLLCVVARGVTAP